MIPFRKLNGRVGMGLHTGIPTVGDGHAEWNFHRLQAHRRLEEVNGALQRNRTERLQLHYAMNRPMLVHRRAMPAIEA